jgi:ketosteroid isomerase-like protein
VQLPQTPNDFLLAYAMQTNTHDFDHVAPLIAEDAVYFFSEGTYTSEGDLRAAFESTWATIRDEEYRIEDVRWLASDERIAVCIYHFRWRGVVNGQPREGMGRGTSVLARSDAGWRVIHEHLSPNACLSAWRTGIVVHKHVVLLPEHSPSLKTCLDVQVATNRP